MSNRNQRGSALLVSLMVMVGLSLLGLAFVAISETESAISVNERNYTQTLQVAEAGAKTVVEWFQNPEWALAHGLMPPNDATAEANFKQERKAIYAPSGVEFTGKYRPSSMGQLLFDLPLKGNPFNRFWGVDEKSADFFIDRSTAAGRDFLDQFNTRIFGDDVEGGKVVDIRVFAPPVLDPLSGNETTEWPAGSGKKFWNLPTRYGVATIKVTAEKRRDPDDDTSPLMARRAVKLVISEFPFPGPEGPLQSNSGIETNGAFRVHWGKVVSLGDLALKREHVSIPWSNTKNMARFESGYDEDAYDPTNTIVDWFPELLGKDFEDPWFQARARGNITTDTGVNTPQPYPYSDINESETAPGVAGYSNQFQYQDIDDEANNKREVLFPRIDYQFWKQVALAGQGQQGMYYLRWVNNDVFVDKRGTQKTFRQWVDTLTTGAEGFFFFDTRTGGNPQLADGSTNTTILTPAVDPQGGDMYMKGFIYLNMETFGSQGLGGPGAIFVNAPGEPFRDIGYHEVDETTMLEKMDPVDPTKPVLVNYTNYEWDYQDINKNDEFDLVLVPKTFNGLGTDNAASSITMLVPKPYFDGCTTLGGADTPTSCSEPHEPYLNLIYPWDNAVASGTSPAPYRVQWETPGSETRRPKKFQSDGVTPVVCSSTSSAADCTSNGRDRDGGLLIIDPKGPILNGVLYNEGGYSSTGNATYFGSVLVRGIAAKAGNVDVWFDESLVKGDWQKRFRTMPRVLITSHETDQ